MFAIASRKLPLLFTLLALGCSEAEGSDDQSTDESEDDSAGESDDESDDDGEAEDAGDTDDDRGADDDGDASSDAGGSDDATRGDAGGAIGDAGHAGDDDADAGGEPADDASDDSADDDSASDDDPGGFGGNPPSEDGVWVGEDGTLMGERVAIPLTSIETGEFRALSEAAGEASGVAQLLRTREDSVVQVMLEGLPPDTTYRVHVYTLPCALDAGGERYKIDPEYAGDDERSNEIWPGVETNARGQGAGRAVAWDHLARGDAQSVIVHAVTGEKMLCADLAAHEERVERAGELRVLEADASLAGSVSMTVAAGQTVLALELSGLDAGEPYSAKVHSMPCEVDDGSDPYLRDPSMPAGADNELRVALDANEEGRVETSVEFADHAARGDAQSLVLHRGDDEVACANLLRSEWPALVTEGTLLAASEAGDAGTPGGSARMTRTLDGVTSLQVELSGMPPEREHHVGVHQSSCAFSDGGQAYYMTVPAGPGEKNEIFLALQTDGEGHALADTSVPHTARPEAQSVVVFDEDGLRLACADLE